MNWTYTIVREGKEYYVWMHDSGQSYDVDPNAIIVGVGPSRDEAVGDAITELEQGAEFLQSPTGIVPEKSV